MKTKKDKRTDLQKEYDSAVVCLKTMDFESEEYSKQLKHVERLHKLLMDEEEHKNVVSKDTLWTAGVGLIQVGLILGYEHLHTVTSRAIHFVVKGRLR